MILLSGHSLTPVRKILAEEQSLTLKERESTTSIKTTDTDGITMTSWMMDETEPGAGIVWRVRSIQDEFAKQTPTIQLEHIINTLRDRILFGEIKADTITGNEGADTCTAREAVEYILAQQSDWELGNFDFGNVTNAYKFDGDTLFDALERVSETLEDPWWSYDMSEYPFQLNITHKPDGVACEQRPGRNLVTVNRTVDKNGMYTRFYPIGKDDLHISGDYVSKNEALYGVISKVETDVTRETEAELIAWANERLKKHAEPRVNITADGLDIAEATGEPLDQLTLGRICRMPLPEFGTTIEERITELTYRDKIHKPTVVRITMANQQEDIMRLIANEMKDGAGPSGSGRGGGGGRGGAREKKEDHAWFEDTNEHVAMVAEGIIGVDATGKPNWVRLSEIIVDGTGIHAGVKSIIGEIIAQQSDIEVNEDRIASEVMRASSEEGMLRSQIIQTASMIYSSVEANNSLIYSEVIQTANEIRSQVNNALSDFYTAIIQTASEIIIRTGDNTKTFHQRTAPTGTAEEPLVDGDIWFDGLGQFQWGDVAGKTWIEDTEFDWGAVAPNSIYRYDGTRDDWVQVQNERALLQDTRFEQSKERIYAVAARVDVVDGRVHEYRTESHQEAEGIRRIMTDSYNKLSANVEATAQKLTSDYVDRINSTESHISQTASQIRMEVSNTENGLHSMIEQTAGQIRMEVSNTASGLQSSITQTASQIRAEVSNAVSGLSSTITQTASQIRLEVKNTSSGLYSMIRQNADEITLRVAKNGVISAINQTAEQIQISAGKIDLSGYVTASQLATTNANISNLVSGYTTATELRATNLRCNNFYYGGTRIYSSYTVQTTGGSTIHVLGYA